jgi:hypothetical protein
MVNLSKYTDGIPFSALRKQLLGVKKHKRTKKRSVSPTRKKRKQRNRTKRKPIKIPKGVIIRKKGQLYRSTGKRLERMTGIRM